jgi:SAM-dependent methyltransferase
MGDIQEALIKTYTRRFTKSLDYRNRVWQILIRDYFARYVSPTSHVLDLGCGYGHFINNVQCARKYAMDLNPDSGRHLSDGIAFLEQDCSHQWQIEDASLDVVFTSNFFEHLPSKDHLTKTLRQAYRCLRPGGRIIAMGPNIKHVPGQYWDFFDHHICLTELSLQEALEIHGFQSDLAVSKFLPYTMVQAREYPVQLISIYLKFPLSWRLFGKQFLVIARR